MDIGVAKITEIGPLFTGEASAGAEKATREWEKRLATLGASMVRTNLDGVLRTQTPFYRLQVTAVPSGPWWRITDQGVVYGPWLEGISERNRSTRFKGYATFRRTSQQIEARATQVGEPVVAEFCARLNGGL